MFSEDRLRLSGDSTTLFRNVPCYCCSSSPPSPQTAAPPLQRGPSCGRQNAPLPSDRINHATHQHSQTSGFHICSAAASKPRSIFSSGQGGKMLLCCGRKHFTLPLDTRYFVLCHHTALIICFYFSVFHLGRTDRGLLNPVCISRSCS